MQADFWRKERIMNTDLADILIVDDETAIADLVEVYLKNEGYTVHKFYNGADALDCVQRQHLDMAILDVMLPDMDGFTLCQRIREAGHLSALPSRPNRTQGQAMSRTKQSCSFSFPGCVLPSFGRRFLLQLLVKHLLVGGQHSRNVCYQLFHRFLALFLGMFLFVETGVEVAYLAFLVVGQREFLIQFLDALLGSLLRCHTWAVAVLC